MFASMLATARYAYWRCSSVFDAAVDPGQQVGKIDLAFMLVLLSAEVYAFAILYLGYIQTIRPLRRPPVPLPADVEQWPHVDILIPTYNEPLLVVRTTAFAAINIDYPPDKLHVYVLDDGRREEFRKFCEEAEIGYVTRTDNKHAKAGNINRALRKSNLALRCYLRLRPRAHSQLSASYAGMVSQRPKAGHAANSPLLLFSRPI